MISEIDIKDWNFEQVREAAREIYTEKDFKALNSLHFVEDFIDRVEALVFFQSPQVAALFKPKKE